MNVVAEECRRALHPSLLSFSFNLENSYQLRFPNVRYRCYFSVYLLFARIVPPVSRKKKKAAFRSNGNFIAVPITIKAVCNRNRCGDRNYSDRMFRWTVNTSL